jgi:hypothetical protein
LPGRRRKPGGEGKDYPSEPSSEIIPSQRLAACEATRTTTTQEGLRFMTDTPRPAAPEQQAQQAEIVLIETGAHAAYSNFARVTSTAEEVIIDFCLNPNPFHQGRQEINVSQRLIMNFYTAKRLFSALGMTLQRHEQTFGPIELDIRRRAQQGAPQQPQTGIRPS